MLGGATVFEIAADKIPVVDHVLHAVGTFIRPLTGTLAAAAALVHVHDPLIALVIGLIVRAQVALAPHLAKATRARSRALNPGWLLPGADVQADASVTPVA